MTPPGLLLGLAAVAIAPMPLRLARAAGRAAQDSDDGSARGLPPFNVIAAVVLAVALLGLLPWPLAPAVAGVAGVLAWRLLPAQPSSVAEQSELAIARSLPDLIDLLAALLRTGLPDVQALQRVAAAAASPLGPMVGVVARHRALGAGPHEAWRTFLDDPVLSPLAQVMIRQADTGSGVAQALDRVAADARRDYFSRAQAAARAAAVRAVIPLAACFLPAFFMLGVAPIVAGLFGSVRF